MTFDYAVENQVQSIPDLITMSAQLTLGGPPQFQQSPTGLPALQSTYGVVPAAFKPLELGSPVQALDQGTVQAAVVQTTDPQLLSGSYPLLRDPEDMFGWGNVVPVASVRALDAEGPAFEATINRVSALLTLSAMRELNAAVELDGQDPADRRDPVPAGRTASCRARPRPADDARPGALAARAETAGAALRGGELVDLDDRRASRPAPARAGRCARRSRTRTAPRGRC